MPRIIEYLKSHHNQLALAAGTSILALAAVSKWVLPEPMGTVPQVFPALVAVVAEAAITKCKGRWMAAPWVWVLAILLSTAVVIGLHLI